MKRKKETFSSPTAKRAEIEEMLTIAQKLTDAGYGYIRIALEAGREGGGNNKNENI